MYKISIRNVVMTRSLTMKSRARSCSPARSSAPITGSTSQATLMKRLSLKALPNAEITATRSSPPASPVTMAAAATTSSGLIRAANPATTTSTPTSVNSIRLFAFPDRLDRLRPEEAAALGEIDVNGFFVSKNVQNALKHGGRQMHPYDPVALVIGFEQHSRIVEANPRDCSGGAGKRDLRPVGLITIRPAVKEHFVSRCLSHSCSPWLKCGGPPAPSQRRPLFTSRQSSPAAPNPPPPGVSITNTSSAPISTIPVAVKVSLVPSDRTT